MELTIKTDVLKNLTMKAMKGAVVAKALPISKYINIKHSDGMFVLTTMNAGMDILEVFEKTEGDDFNITISAELFSKLVDKTSSENITLKIFDTHLEFKGNGKYSIEIPQEDGKAIPFPTIDSFIEAPKGKKDAIFSLKNKTAKEIKVETLQQIFKLHETAVGQSMSMPAFTGFFFTDKQTVSTDGRRIVISDIPVFEENTLLPYSLFELVTVASGDIIKVFSDKEYVLFLGSNFRAFGKKMDSDMVAKFPVAAMNKLAATDYEGNVQVSKDELLSVIDRMSLFVDLQDRNGVKFNFTPDGLIVSNYKSSSNEQINAKSDKKIIPAVCSINIDYFKSLLNANPHNVINLSYGGGKSIKVSFDKTVQILALLEDK